jgi:integrase
MVTPSGPRRDLPDLLGQRLAAGERWTETGLVFTTSVGTKMLAGNVRRDFRRALTLLPGIDPSEWTPRELRLSFVSLLSDAGVPVEEIPRFVGHSGTTVTELVYRHQLKPRDSDRCDRDGPVIRAKVRRCLGSQFGSQCAVMRAPRE